MPLRCGNNRNNIHKDNNIMNNINYYINSDKYYYCVH